MKAGFRQKEFAMIIGMHPSTISREIQRNRGQRGYRLIQAHQKSLDRRSANPQARIPYSTWSLVESLIQQDWSLEQISGRLSMEQGIAISHEWIYLYIYQDKQQGGGLHAHLRCQKKRRKRHGQQERRGRIPHRVGDWEGDTIIGKGHRDVIASLVERKTKYTVPITLKPKQARPVCQSIGRALTPHWDRVHTITYDNGLEFAEHHRMANTLSAKIYFAQPYVSWKRGLKENTNGLIRQYLPKSKRLDNVTQKQLEYIMEKLNHRPRKSLGFKTPHELFKLTNQLTIALAG